MKLVSASGFEPDFAGPKPAVLSKLYYAPIHSGYQTKFIKIFVINQYVNKGKQEILENVIEAQLDLIEYKITEEKAKRTLPEFITLSIYIGQYCMLEKYPKYFTYLGRIADIYRK